MKFVVVSISMFLIACSSTKKLTNRGIYLKEDRLDFINSNPDIVSRNHMANTYFIAGKAAIGMTKKMVIGLFGPPENNPSENTWKYNLINNEVGIIEFVDDVAKTITNNLLVEPTIED